MFTSTTIRAGALVAAVVVVLTGVMLLPHGVAAADPNPDDQFVALLDQKGIPALDNVPSLIATAHRVCRQLDGGMPVDGVVNDMRERAFKANSPDGQYPADRVHRTIARFISAAVEAYCPNNEPKIASLQGVANILPGSGGPAQRVSVVHAIGVASQAPRGAACPAGCGALPLGETAQPEPPQLPPPPPPTAQNLTPPKPIVTPSPPQKPPPPQQQGPLPGTQEGPPAAPAPGGPPGGGGADPEPPPGPPGRVRLAP
ncbi:DUF732 domain-containing protein [Mycobacterium sp. HNNTM2301]|uniref:DUF732 domain-containing protein n=1 Tax=Mycobacterium hainanense TaxID=3289775 RepID=UPI0035A6EC71